jgi:zinc/manganese transport system substrate-binding protein
LDRRGGDALRRDAAPYVAQLEQVDKEAENALLVVPPDRRKLVTNHEAFGYFADRYRFEVLGGVIPGGGTQAAASAAALDELAAVIREAQVKGDLR